ncbi:MAG: DNA polymerase II [Acidilobus sp.]
MGRTQPSLTVAVEGELAKLRRVASRLRVRGLRERLDAVMPVIRQVEEAFEDELADPLEVLLLALLLTCGDPSDSS